MRVRIHRKFKKQLGKLPRKTQLKFKARLKLFAKNPRDRRLRVHRLRGEFANHYSFDVTGDIRVVFEWQPGQYIELNAMGSHTQIYG